MNVAGAREYPLTEAQEGLWYAQRLDPDNPIFNTGQVLDISGTVDVDALTRAVATAMGAADALAVRVVEQDGRPLQVVDEACRASLEVVDLRGETDPVARAHARIKLDMDSPVDLSHGPAVREVLFLVGDARYLWYHRAHHVVIDGYGTAILTKRIVDLYDAFSRGAAATGTSFAPFPPVLAQDEEYRHSERRDGDRAFWRAQLEGAPAVVGLQPGEAVTSRTFIREACAVPETLTSSLVDLARTAGVPWPDAATTCIAAYLLRHIGGEETVVGVPAMERLGTPAARVPAMVMNVLPFRVRFDEDLPIVEVLKQDAARLRELRRHGKYRSEQLRRDLGLIGGERRLYGALINVLPFEQAYQMPGASVQVQTLGTGPVDDITITLRGTPASGLHLELDANPALYDAHLLRRHLARLVAFLGSVVASPTIGEVSLATAEEREWALETVNQTATPLPDVTLVDLIESVMQRDRTREALVSGDESLTYEDLDRRTHKLAAALRAAGVRRGDLVAVVLPRSLDLVLSLVAILRAGAAYLPVDPSHPQDRVRRMFETAAPALVVTGEWMAASSRQEPAPDGSTFERPQPADAAYVIYTSGSTGEPKGALIEHRAIVNRLEWMRTHYAIEPGDRILQKTPATFDVSVWEFFLAFLSGATLVVAPPDAHKDPAWLASLVRTHGITTMHFVPSMLAAFLDEPSAAGLSVRRIFCSGEALPAALRDRCHQVLDCELHNLYGPTEAAVDVTYWDASRHDHSSPVPIGYPVWNTQMYVLDARLRPVPVGVTGDLYIAGVQLAREYVGRPDLTSERFVPSPFVEGARMYKTGDLAQRLDSGALVFLGRSDHQVKIRGFRIELGEIETALVAAPGVKQAGVVVRTVAGDPQLVAYVVPSQETAFELAVVQDHLRRVLPDYMVPGHIVVLDELPLTRSGKLDRNALPALPETARTQGRALSTETERRVAALFADVLGLGGRTGADSLHADDDFFALGGHSLLAARLMTRVRATWPCQLRLGVLFANPTIARFAAAIDGEADVARTVGAAVEQGLGPTVHLTRASAARPAVFCLHPAGGISWCYGRLARALQPVRDVYGLQADALVPDGPVPASIEEMAARYCDRVRALQPEGPYHLVGWSIGGIIAHAMAVRFEQQGAAVGTVCMLDAYPSDHWRRQAEPEARAALRALLLIAGHDPSAIKGDLTLERVVGFLRAEQHPLGDLSDDSLRGVLRAVEGNNRLVRRFEHGVFHGRILYVRASLDHQDDGLSPEMWAPYVGGLEVHDVPALHATLTGDLATAIIAPLLNAHLGAQDAHA